MTKTPKFDFDSSSFQKARLAVIGVGGAGGNAVATMVERNVENVIHMVANTDIQALERSPVPIQLQLGEDLTKGLGAGGNPAIGTAAAEESLGLLEKHIDGVNMLFITAGMGGGTGTGAAPVIAHRAMEKKILTVGIVTRPFRFEGRRREEAALAGIEKMKESVNTLIVIPNQRLLELDDSDMSVLESFKRADDVLVNAVRGISDLITTAGYVNVDFADVRSIMSNMGMAIMGSGASSGADRALTAARQAISSPLLDNMDIRGAKGVLVNVTGSSNLSLREMDEAVSYIQESADPQANFIFGYVIDEELKDEVKVTVVATGFSGEAGGQQRDERIRRRRVFQADLPQVPAAPPRERVEVRSRVDAEATRTITNVAKTGLPELPRLDDLEASSFDRQFVGPAVGRPDDVSIPSYRRRVAQQAGRTGNSGDLE